MLFAPLRDQRRSERRWIALPVQIRMGKALIEGTTLNLSDHGMYLFTAANIALDSKIEIVFRLPEEKELVQVSAVVRRKVVYLYGIEFLNCSENVAPQVTGGKAAPESRGESRDCDATTHS